ncbi:MAG: hypothetical protein AAGI07_09980, partial [Bacteroidota bacterium]
MMKKYILYLTFVFFSFVSVRVGWGQELPIVIPPSPDAAALGEYGDIPVGLYTGIPNINIPLYTIQDKDINIPISLSYHAGGIRVSEEASSVGLGWTLNAGGAITKTVRGLDDSERGYFNYALPQPYSEVDKGNCNVLMSNGSTVNYTEFFQGQVPYSSIDSEPDLYYFNFMGMSGKFTYNQSEEIVIINQQKIKIEQIPQAPFNHWIITTNDGYVYEFDEPEITSTLEQPGGDEFASTWYLKRITSPTNNTIEFTYTENPNFVRPYGSFSQSIFRPVYDGVHTVGNDLPVIFTDCVTTYNPT